MKISRIRIKRVMPDKGLVGFVSFVIDDWLFVGNIALFTRLNDEGKVRLVFPQKQLKTGSVNIFHPLTSEGYFVLEQAVQEKFKTLKDEEIYD